MIGKALTAVLQARRADFNQLFRRAQQQYRGLEAETWFAFVRDTLNPLAEIIASRDEAAVSAVIEVLYEQSLPLVAQQWLGAKARIPELAGGYTRLLAALAPALTRDPARVSGALLNALYQLGQSDPQRARQWAEKLAAIVTSRADSDIANIANIDAVLALGRLLAWRTGLPSHREAALREGPRLPTEWARQALDLPRAPEPALWQALARSPTMRADEFGAARAPNLEWLGRCGGYRGLGGPFAALPVIGMAGGRLAASDGESTWWLAADGYGTQAVRMGARGDWPLDTNTPGSLPASVTAEGKLSVGQYSGKWVELETANAAVWHAGVVAVTLRTSYQVALLRGPGL